MTEQLRWPWVDLGLVVATPGVLATVDGATITGLLARHQTGDWGDLGAEDKRANDRALARDERVFSAYDVDGARVWIITEADRSSTCVLLPSEY